MKYKLILFDFDGTLADTFPWFMSILNDVAEKYHFNKVETHEIETLRGYSPLKVIGHLRIPKWKIPMVTRYVLSLMGHNIHQISLFDGVSQLLRQLSQKGVVLGILSSNSMKNIASVFGPRNFALFDYVECGVSLFGKETKLNSILKHCGVRKSECLYIGDEVRDVEAAKKEGIHSGAVSWGYNNLEALVALEPEAIFYDMSEIEKLAD